jgi:hypothetical protein
VLRDEAMLEVRDYRDAGAAPVARQTANRRIS